MVRLIVVSLVLHRLDMVAFTIPHVTVFRDPPRYMGLTTIWIGHGTILANRTLCLRPTCRTRSPDVAPFVDPAFGA
jgi:hypothetical protein